MQGHRELGFFPPAYLYNTHLEIFEDKSPALASAFSCHFRSGHHFSFSRFSSEVIAQWIPSPSPCWQLSRPRLGRSPSGAPGSQQCLSSWLPKVPSTPGEGSHHSGPQEPGKRPACPQRLVLPVVLLSQAGLKIDTCD